MNTIPKYDEYKRIYMTINKLMHDLGKELILFGGYGLNFVVKGEPRISKDMDFVIILPNSKSEMKKLINLIKLQLNEIFDIRIEHVRSRSDFDKLIIDKKAVCKYGGGFIAKFYFEFEEKDYYLDITYDETFKNIDYTENDDGIKLISKEYYLASKFIIANKLIKLNEIFNHQNARHIYDLFRLESNGKFDIELFKKYYDDIKKYELSRKDNKLDEYFFDNLTNNLLNFLNEVINEWNNDKFNKTNLDKIIQILNNEYDLDLKGDELITRLESFVHKIKN